MCSRHICTEVREKVESADSSEEDAERLQALDAALKGQGGGSFTDAGTTAAPFEDSTRA